MDQRYGALPYATAPTNPGAQEPNQDDDQPNQGRESHPRWLRDQRRAQLLTELGALTLRLYATDLEDRREQNLRDNLPHGDLLGSYTLWKVHDVAGPIDGLGKRGQVFTKDHFSGRRGEVQVEGGRVKWMVSLAKEKETDEHLTVKVETSYSPQWRTDELRADRKRRRSGLGTS